MLPASMNCTQREPYAHITLVKRQLERYLNPGPTEEYQHRHNLLLNPAEAPFCKHCSYIILT